MNKKQEEVIHDYLTLICKNNKLKEIKINYKYNPKKERGYMNSTWDKQKEE